MGGLPVQKPSAPAQAPAQDNRTDEQKSKRRRARRGDRTQLVSLRGRCLKPNQARQLFRGDHLGEIWCISSRIRTSRFPTWKFAIESDSSRRISARPTDHGHLLNLRYSPLGLPKHETGWLFFTGFRTESGESRSTSLPALLSRFWIALRC